MPTWNNSDFEREATDIARTFWAGKDQNGSSLNELTTKVARDHSLNPEQIRRLCRAANTQAFGQKHASLQGEDRTPEFDLSDAEAVIGSLSLALTGATKVASAFYGAVPDEYARPAPPIPQASLTKVASEYVAPPRALGIELDRALRETKDLGYERIGLNDLWETKIAELKSRARLQTWEHDAFEKNAVALYGADALPELNALRTVLGRDPIETGPATLAKLGSLQEQWLGVEDAHAVLLKQAMDLRAQYATVKVAHEKAEARMKSLSARKL